MIRLAALFAAALATAAALWWVIGPLPDGVLLVLGALALGYLAHRWWRDD